MTTIEKLDADDFPILRTVADGYCPDPAHSVAIVAREGQECVGRMLLLGLVHVEGTWIAPTHRGGRVLLGLMARAKLEAKQAGLTHLLAYAATPEVESYLSRLGYTRLPVSVWQQEL